MKHIGTIRAALLTLERGGFRMAWESPSDEQDFYVFTAANRQGETWSVSGEDPVAALAELTRQLALSASET